MRGKSSAYGFVLLAALAAAASGWGCGGDNNGSEATLQAEETTESFEANPPPPFQKIAVCPAATTGQVTGPTGTGTMTGQAATGVSGQTATGVSIMSGIVCGKDGKTHSDVCTAGGLVNVAHDGGCADFVCNGAVCPAGSFCRSPSGPGTPYRCVAD
jgi:hypothetical protein